MTNKIVWEKWVDPFLINIEENEQEKDEVYKDSYEKAEEKSKGMSQTEINNKNYSGPVMIGPMGIIPLNENNIPSKVYCFWMGHTNFDITYKIQQKIASVSGVESLDIFTRYRFRMSIGKAFLNEHTDPFGREVMLSVEGVVAPKEKIVDNSVKSVPEYLTNIKKHLNKTYKYWIIFAKKDGTLETKGASTKEEIILEFNDRSDETVAFSWE